MLIPKCALIRAAICHVNKQHRGASLIQVRKHLEANYNEKLNAKKKKLIRTTFKALIQEGKLQRKGTIYKSTTKARAIVRADVPQRRNRRHRRRRTIRRRRSRRHRRRRPRLRHHHHHHHGRHHHRRRHHGKHHHRSLHHRRHHSRRRHHHRHHHDFHGHCHRHRHRRHGDIDMDTHGRQYKERHHGETVSVEVPLDKLAITPTTSKPSPQKKT